MTCRRLVVVVAALTLVASASAATVDWKGLTWELRGASTAAVVNGSGYLDISVLGNETGQGPDNWNVMGALPAELNQANAGWVEISWLGNEVDEDGHGPGPRAYLDTWENNHETMFQAGCAYYIGEYFANHHVYSAASGTYITADWFMALSSRVDGEGLEHTFLVGMKSGGDVDMWFDGALIATIPASPNLTLLETAFLGLDGENGTTFTGTYTDFQYGTGYIPEPASLLLLSVATLLARRR